MRTARTAIALLLCVGFALAATACVEPASGSANRDGMGANNTSSGDMNAAANMAGGEDRIIVSAYHSQEKINSALGLHCFIVPGDNGALPLVLSTPVDDGSLDVEDFIIGAGEETMTPVCAKLIPFPGEHEKSTIVLIGNFGDIGGAPETVDIVGQLTGSDGTSLRGARADVTPLGAGTELVWAERYAPDEPGFSGDCPGGTAQVIQLVWSSGVKGAGGEDFGEDSANALTFELENGESASPMVLVDDDSDNYMVACLGATSPASAVSVSAEAFADLGGNTNPAGSVRVVEHEQ